MFSLKNRWQNPRKAILMFLSLVALTQVQRQYQNEYQASRSLMFAWNIQKPQTDPTIHLVITAFHLIHSDRTTYMQMHDQQNQMYGQSC